MGTGCNSFATAVRRQVQRCLCAGQRSHTTQTWHRQNLWEITATCAWDLDFFRAAAAAAGREASDLGESFSAASRRRTSD